MVANALPLICRWRTHHPRLWTDCSPHASICTLGGLRFLSHSWPNSSLALWTGRMLQPVPVLTSQSVWCILESSDCATQSGLMCSMSLCFIYLSFVVVLRFYRCFCLIVCVIKWSCVLTLGTVLRLLFCIHVFDLSLVTLCILPTHAQEMSNSVACIALHSYGSTLLSGVVGGSPTIFTYLCWTVPVVLPGSGPVAPVGPPAPVGAASAPVACSASVVLWLVLI